MIHGYIRVSTEGQNDGSSPEEQERRIRAFAEIARAGEEPAIWRDTISGAVPVNERPNGAAMIEALRPGDTVIAAKLDRLFRSAEDALSRSRAWREAKIDLILTDMGADPVTTSAAGRMYFGMLAQFAEFERERIAERVRAGKSNKRANGGFPGGHAPIGYRVEGQGPTATLCPDKREIELVAATRWLAKSYDFSPTRIAAQLNRLGYHSRSNTPIVATQVWRWLRRDIRFLGPEPEEGGGQVYRCYDALDRLRYIGSSKDARKRLNGHKTESRDSYLELDWYAWVVLVTIENHPTRKMAYLAEADAQKTEEWRSDIDINILSPIHRELREPSNEAKRRIVDMI